MSDRPLSKSTEEESAEVHFSPLMHIPLLTEAEKRALIDEPNHGITPAVLTHFDTYEDWQKKRSRASHFLGYFLDSDNGKSIFDGYRELQCFQRLLLLNPELITELTEKVGDLPDGTAPDEITDRLLMEAYKQMAALTDVNDVIPDGRDAAGNLDPSCLLI